MDHGVHDQIGEDLPQAPWIAVEFEVRRAIDHNLVSALAKQGSKTREQFFEPAPQFETPPFSAGLVDRDLFEAVDEVDGAGEIAEEQSRALPEARHAGFEIR